MITTRGAPFLAAAPRWRSASIKAAPAARLLSKNSRRLKAEGLASAALASLLIRLLPISSSAKLSRKVYVGLAMLDLA
jgi:hypothetical protein